MLRGIALFAGVAAASSVDENANPIRRVVTLMQKMAEKIKAEGEEEQKLYDKFSCFCSGNTKGMSSDAEAAATKMKTLKATIEELSAKKASTDNEVSEAKADRSEAQAALAKATAIREKENADFQKNAGDSRMNIEALNKAISTLSKGMGASALLQGNTDTVARLRKIAMVAENLSSYEKEGLLSFLGVGGPYGDYNPASGEIVGILKTMKDQMDSDLGGIVKTEEDAQRNYEELKGAKTAEIKAASSAIEKKSVRSGELAVSVVEAKNDLKDTGADLEETQKFLANLSVQCDEKAKEWDERTKTRNEELMAISEAIKILNDDDALDIFKKTLPSPGAPANVLLQTGRHHRSVVQAYALLHASARTTKNPALSLLAGLLKQGNVDFSKVIKMIDDMSAHLEKEQKDDDKQRAWCNKEFDTSDDTKKDLRNTIDDITADMDHAKAEIAALKEEIADLTASISSLDKMVAESTEQRKKEHAEFVSTTAEVTAATQLIEKAKNRLNKFYNPKLYKAPPTRELSDEERVYSNMGGELAAEAPQYIEGTTQTVNFMQVRLHTEMGQPVAPDTWGAGGYKNKGSQSGGVTALMDMLLKDLATQMQEGEHDEKTAQRDYETLMQESGDKRAEESQAVTDKNSAKAGLEGRLQEMKENRSSKADEYAENDKYIAELHGSCDFLITNYDFRKAARANERDALKNAKAVLNGASYSFLQMGEEPKEEAAKEESKDLEVNYQKIAPFGKEDTAQELQSHAAKTQDTLVDAVENAEVAEIKRSVFRSLTRLRAATIKEFDTIARLETQAIDAYNDAHHYRAENPLSHLHTDEAPVETDKLKSFH